jgi:hypothetical protein
MKTINIKTIRIDGGTQSRVEINNEIVTEYSDAIKAGAEFPAVVVFNDGADNWLADGFHRFHAHNQAGKTSIAADVRPGTARDAVLYSLGANGTHGLNRTNADKRKAVVTMLNDAEWAKWSNGEIAKSCSVSGAYVGQVRSSLTINVSSEKPVERTFTTKHVTVATMQTANIGKVTTPENKPAPTLVIVPAVAPEDEYTPLDAAHDQINELQAELVVARINSTDSEEAAQAAALIAELRAHIRTLEATNKALTVSRDGFQAENAQLKKQINMQRREIDKVTGRKTA